MEDNRKNKKNLEMLGTNELPTDIEGGRVLPINLVGEMKRSFISMPWRLSSAALCPMYATA